MMYPSEIEFFSPYHGCVVYAVALRASFFVYPPPSEMVQRIDCEAVCRHGHDMCNVAALRRYMIPITRRELLDAPVYGGTPWDLGGGEKGITFIRR